MSNSATAVFLDEYTPTGTLVQSIALPTAVSGSNNILTASGTATSEGELNLSSNGQYLALTGYDATIGTATVATSSTTSTTPPPVPRVIGVVTGDGSIDTSTAVISAAINGNNIRAAYTNDGTNLYFADAVNGVDYTTDGSSSITQLETSLTNARDVVISNGQLYVDTASGSTFRIATVGMGTPTTSGQTVTEVPGVTSSTTTGTPSPYAFFLTTLSSASASPDTLYVADSTNSDIIKFSLANGSFTETGTITGLTGVEGLTGSTTNGVVSLYASTSTGIYDATDSSGYDVNAAGAATLIASAATNEAFRGIAFAPQLSSNSGAVPEPGALPLLAEAAALIAGLGMTRRRKQ